MWFRVPPWALPGVMRLSKEPGVASWQDLMLFQPFEGRKREGKFLVLVCSWVAEKRPFKQLTQQQQTVTEAGPGSGRASAWVGAGGPALTLAPLGLICLLDQAALLRGL